ncbi:MAG: hypothetical protein KBE65_20635 [Phycisphaerae bacterium]|nr:hypothetical protein [Phycisphaerae bacterium]
MANQTTQSSTVSPQSNEGRRPKPDFSAIARAAKLLLVCVILATIGVTALFRYQNWVYRYVGGEIRQAPAELNLQEAFREIYPSKSQDELNKLRGFKNGTTVWISHTASAYWVSQAFHNGWVQYAILLGFTTGLLYTLGVRQGRLIPSWHPWLASHRFQRVAAQMVELRKTGVDNVDQVIERIGGNDRFMDRLRKLQQHYSREPNRQLCREANEAYSQFEQAEALYVIFPLVFIEFVLPVFGFIGTVLGVSDAVVALRWGMHQLFEANRLTDAVMSQFMLGFDGLVLAFMTTLFGLLGLAFTALFRFHLRRNAMAVIAQVDKWSEETINLLPQEDLLKTIADGLMVQDENGQRVPLLHKLDELLRETLFETSQDGEKPIPTLQAVHRMLHELHESLGKALFEPGKEGEEPIPALQGVRRMIKIATEAVYGIHNALMHHIYQIVGYDDRNHYTDLIVYTTDKETGETHSMEVQGRYRSERQHAETIGWMRTLTEEILEKLPRSEENGTDDVINRGRLVISPAEEPVCQIAASPAAFAIVRGTDHTTGESELVSGCYETINGQLLPHETDRKRVPMGIAGLGFSCGQGTEASRFGVYMPFAPADPWQLHRAQQLLPAQPLVKCAATFLGDHEVLSERIAFLKIKELRWLLFLAREVGIGQGGKIGLFALLLESEQDTPRQIGDLLEGELAGEAVFQGGTYAFALRSGGSTNIVVASPGDGKPAMRCIKARANVTALAFDSTGALHYASQEREIGTVALDKGSLQRECQLDHRGQIAHLAYSSNKTVYVVLRDSAELVLVRLDGGDGKQPESKTVAYPRLITALTASSDGRFIFVGCADGSVYSRNG